jgi:hypothetical protein
VRQLQRRCIGEWESLGREGDFSAPAAKCTAIGRNDDLWVVFEKNKQQQLQPQVPSTGSGQALRLAHSRIAPDDNFLGWVNS